MIILGIELSIDATFYLAITARAIGVQVHVRNGLNQLKIGWFLWYVSVMMSMILIMRLVRNDGNSAQCTNRITFAFIQLLNRLMQDTALNSIRTYLRPSSSNFFRKAFSISSSLFFVSSALILSDRTSASSALIRVYVFLNDLPVPLHQTDQTSEQYFWLVDSLR